MTAVSPGASPDGPGRTAEATSSTGRTALPLLLPSATLGAFVLLIVSVLSFTVVHHPAFYSLLTGHVHGSIGSGNDCMRRAIAEAGGTDAAVRLWTSGRHVPGGTACARSNGYHDQTAAALLAFGVLAVVTGLHYWFRSTWRARRRGVVPVTPERFPGLHGELERLSRETVPGTSVRWVVDLLEPAVTGVAFGRVRRRHLLLSRGALGLRTRDPEAFRALVLHELAHLRNRDLDLTLVALGFTRAYLALVWAPYVFAALVFLVFGVEWRLNLAVAGQMLGMAGLLAVARATVLRTREYQADARVAVWQGSAAPLTRLFAAATAGPSSRSWWGRVRALAFTHPDPRLRAAALEDPAPVMEPGAGLSFLLGVCLVLAWDPRTSPAARMGVGRVVDFWPPEPFTVVLVVVLCLAVLRAAVYAAATGSPVRLPALRTGLTAGVVAGTVLSPSLVVTPMLLPGVGTGVEAASTAVLAGVVLLFVVWLEFLCSCWAVAVVAARHRWRPAAFPVSAAVCVALACAPGLFGLHGQALFDVHVASDPLRGLPAPLFVVAEASATAVLDFLSRPLWLVTGAALLLLPAGLGVWLVRRIGGVVPRVPDRAWGRGRAYATGVVGFVVVLVTSDLYVELYGGVPVSLLSPGPTLAAACAGTSACVAVRAARGPVLSGMTGAALCAVGVGLFMADEFRSARQIVFWGAYGLQTALAAALLVRVVRRAARRRAAGT
ncbi:M48 family metalloprotease [Streptomyces winkii]|uniref:M48 family metalloprotease n=1 Tax=Streptomyces winkii TaxID=3051178 RepID=UPI0028D474CD|nr:M48 family metalloprotease [Streptomyces sp. DSM 40971]